MIEYLSYSSINLFLTCGEAWRRKYIAKEPQAVTPPLVFGSALHNTIESYIEAKAELGPGFNYALTDKWGEIWQHTLEKQPECEWGASQPEEHYNEGVRLLNNPDLVQMVNRLTPLRDEAGLFMEREVFVNVPGVPVPIKGYIDIVTKDGVPGDFKTSATSWSNEKAAKELQPLFYLAAMNQLGMDSPGLRFRHYVITKTKTPKVQVIETQHTYDSIFWLYGLVQQVWRAIESETFVVNPHAWLCSPKYCNAWSQCRGRGM